MSAHAQLNLLNELRQRNTMLGCTKNLSLFLSTSLINSIIYVGAQMLIVLSHDSKNTLKSLFCLKMLRFCHKQVHMFLRHKLKLLSTCCVL